jgi:hypothetical protein
MEISIKLAPHFHVWKKEIENSSRATTAFERWLFVRASGVLFGKKAGELFSLRANLFDVSRNDRLRCIADLAQSWQFSYMLLKECADCDKIILYNEVKVQGQLKNTPPCFLCNELGYKENIDPVTFLSEVKHRWKTENQIPHEIGLALGYPIKDVVGFMGYLPLPCTGSCG